ncbi:hypothetical protein FISHEDRAFT_68992 [Fistulina hepatica ATCC 64428]|uniref:Uncharacterized protein n=1 Tax=Fistulina hepatica ATCC 64428 TaxID=1128425 RepID=A0A0D7AP95_9AGAR|nr:hypothetical protein FISHEDRAFT_68992 [Fistulina hepatica ATCC 64428]
MASFTMNNIFASRTCTGPWNPLLDRSDGIPVDPTLYCRPRRRGSDSLTSDGLRRNALYRQAARKLEEFSDPGYSEAHGVTPPPSAVLSDSPWSETIDLPGSGTAATTSCIAEVCPQARASALANCIGPLQSRLAAGQPVSVFKHVFSQIFTPINQILGELSSGDTAQQKKPSGTPLSIPRRLITGLWRLICRFFLPHRYDEKLAHLSTGLCSPVYAVHDAIRDCPKVTFEFAENGTLCVCLDETDGLPWPEAIQKIADIVRHEREAGHDLDTIHLAASETTSLTGDGDCAALSHILELLSAHGVFNDFKRVDIIAPGNVVQPLIHLLAHQQSDGSQHGTSALARMREIRSFSWTGSSLPAPTFIALPLSDQLQHIALDCAELALMDCYSVLVACLQLVSARFSKITLCPPALGALQRATRRILPQLRILAIVTSVPFDPLAKLSMPNVAHLSLSVLPDYPTDEDQYLPEQLEHARAEEVPLPFGRSLRTFNLKCAPTQRWSVAVQGIINTLTHKSEHNLLTTFSNPIQEY